MLIEEPEIVTDERHLVKHIPDLPEGILEHHLNADTQKQLAVQNLNKVSFLVTPDGKRAVSTEIKNPAHLEIIEQSLQTVLGERLDDKPYLPQAASGLLGTSAPQNFVELNSPEHIRMLADAGVKDFAPVKQQQHARTEEPSHVARLQAEKAGEHVPAKAA